ncbi:hypothetical protein [Bradyrhizobium sp. 188]|uniref:hypothetical protein n=1 Tax=Bradyrhizobium sp. 188 TaxID=2782656 RepID=UPI001FF8372A|nr:hypothetical protein [Bradyrhizobium sp. 188]MCK1498657.1 hypothetical protein [Bradyrhizobium sp. 188]
MELNDLLRGREIEPRKVLVLRHRPTEPDLNKVLPLLAVDKPELFNAYQQTQGAALEKSMSSASYVASFIGHEPGKALYVGLYKIGKTKTLTVAQYLKVPEKIELMKLGMKGPTGKRPSCLWIDLKLTDFYSEWKGKLIVDWPPPERSWWRRAHQNTMPCSRDFAGWRTRYRNEALGRVGLHLEPIGCIAETLASQAR